MHSRNGMHNIYVLSHLSKLQMEKTIYAIEKWNAQYICAFTVKQVVNRYT